MELSLGGPFAWSTPSDPARVGALAFGVALLVLGRRLTPRAVCLAARGAPLVAALLSAAYVVYYLRGGPRIIDATAYYLEGRTLAEGRLTIPLAEPEQSLLGRFLVRGDLGASTASVIFPPGWPMVLALGFKLGVPLAVGPIIAALLTVVTGALARASTPGSGDEPSTALAGAVASWLSVGCGALRYHTADTMSHGWAALCVVTFAFALTRLAHEARTGWCVTAGLAIGWLFATRPASALAAVGAAVVACFIGGWTMPPRNERPRLVFWLAVGALAPLALWFSYQHAASGSWLGTAQGRYYSVSDGPPGCFRYGFGSGIGCVGEHGDFVQHHLGDGYGLTAAAGTTVRRLALHVTDVLNFGPLAALVVFGAARSNRNGRMLLLLVVAQVVVYAPFYFDGSYPGGGARMFADVLPIEHALAAVGVVALSRRKAGEVPSPRRRFSLGMVFGLMFVGFAVGAGADHAALREREGGRPMFEDRVLREAGVDAHRALIFTDTDHGFLLARAAGIEAVRAHGDSIDKLSWEARGRPSSYEYRYRFEDGRAELVPKAFDPAPSSSSPLRIEGESLWPPIAQENGFAWPSWRVPQCSSKRRTLSVEGPASTRIELRLPRALAGRAIVPIVLATPGVSNGALELRADGELIRGWEIARKQKEDCVRLTSARIPLDSKSTVLSLLGGGWALDALDIPEIP